MKVKMTECERLVKTDFISYDFLQAEIRNDYYISEKQKKIWAINLDLISFFANICKKYSLRWCLMFGSLLGAVRHQGFIPWDDDVDVAMPRDDYEKLLNLSHEFPSPYFLQTPFSDKNYYYSYAKIRNSNTTCLSRSFRNQGFNQGIMLDIFCIDKWNKEEGYKIYNEIGSLIIDNSNYMRRNMANPTEKDIERINSYSGNDPLENYLKIQNMSKRYHDEATEDVSLPVIQAYSYERNVFKKEDFEHTISVKFEGKFEFPIPVGYRRILQTIYGNYYELPPLQKRGTWHDSIIDPDKPYSLALSESNNNL